MGTTASQYTRGYRVLDVQPNSPGLRAGLVSFFDFIMKADDQTFETEGDELVTVLSRHQGRKLALVVYNTKSRTYREVTIVPSDNWGGDGAVGSRRAKVAGGCLDRRFRVLWWWWWWWWRRWWWCQPDVTVHCVLSLHCSVRARSSVCACVAGLLGITIRHDSYDVSDNYIRVLEVLPGSPAEEAGLIPESDYILGTAGRRV
jgi:C-terminal processing protease CtpA/Prc